MFIPVLGGKKKMGREDIKTHIHAHAHTPISDKSICERDAQQKRRHLDISIETITYIRVAKLGDLGKKKKKKKEGVY